MTHGLKNEFKFLCVQQQKKSKFFCVYAIPVMIIIIIAYILQCNVYLLYYHSQGLMQCVNSLKLILRKALVEKGYIINVILYMYMFDFYS